MPCQPHLYLHNLNRGGCAEGAGDGVLPSAVAAPCPISQSAIPVSQMEFRFKEFKIVPREAGISIGAGRTCADFAMPCAGMPGGMAMI